MRLTGGAAMVVAFAVAAAPAGAEPVELRGTMTISTSSAGSVLVHVPDRTRTFPDADGKGAIGFTFGGKSVLRALVLLAETPGSDGKRFVGYVDGSVGEGGEGEWPASDMPAGDYRLYAITDGRPTTIKVEMPSGGAEAPLAVPDPVASDVHLMQTGGSGVFHASAMTTGPGTVFAVATATFGAGQAGTAEFCDAVGQSADSDASYTLGCSQGDVNPLLGGGDFGSLLVATRFDTTGAQRHGFGGNVQSITPPAIDGAVAAITFTPPGVPSAGSSPISPVGAVVARVVGKRVRASRTGRAPVRVRCAGPGSCHVRVSVSGSSSKGKATIPAGATRKVNVRLGASLRKRLKRSRSVRATLILRVTGGAGGGTTVTRSRVTFTAPR